MSVKKPLLKASVYRILEDIEDSKEVEDLLEQANHPLREIVKKILLCNEGDRFGNLKKPKKRGKTKNLRLKYIVLVTDELEIFYPQTRTRHYLTIVESSGGMLKGQIKFWCKELVTEDRL